MPVYLYACGACGSRREILHGMSEAPRAACTSCGGALERVFTAPALNLGNQSSPTAARYAKLSPTEEVANIRAELEAVRRAKGRREEEP